ncbi:MAG TPA: hypothetical protein DD706_06400 [Nitrospiraceae bacterium]|nr:hypothetical protein [Nitrospiraceae bacterium]
MWERYIENLGTPPRRHTEVMYWCCKGSCDAVLEKRYRRMFPDCNDVWEDIPDLKMPIVFIRWVMAVLNELQGEHTYADQAFDANKELLLSVFPYVCRDLTSEECDRVQGLSMLPSYLGEVGY